MAVSGSQVLNRVIQPSAQAESLKPASLCHKPAVVLCCCSYLTFAIGTVAEVVALLVVGPTVDRLGRHNIVALGQLLGGSACVACAMVSVGAMQAVLAAIGKFGCSGEMA